MPNFIFKATTSKFYVSRKTNWILIVWLSKPMWITLLDPFALHAPFHHSTTYSRWSLCRVLCASADDDNCGGWIGFFLGCFLLILYHIASDTTQSYIIKKLYPTRSQPKKPAKWHQRNILLRYTPAMLTFFLTLIHVKISLALQTKTKGQQKSYAHWVGNRICAENHW